MHVSTRNKTLAAVRAELLRHYPVYDPKQKTPPQSKPPSSNSTQNTQLTIKGALVILDSLNPLATSSPDSLAAFLSNIISPTASLVAVYHTDVPLVSPPHVHNEYAPPPLAILTHLATAVLRLSNLDHEIARKKARDRSVQEPEFGIAEGREGVLIGMQEKRARGAGTGLVVEMEVRRRSGRGVSGTFVVSIPAPAERRKGAIARFCLLEAHPAFAPAVVEENEEEPASTFDLGLTEKQRRDREGVVLPYFDAQTDIGAGEGGRILYEMGREDDFDEEEDEV